ncbi:MAG: alpha/beta hydrolase-fold protein [candidate division Zixibacteria bacterium]
MRYSRSLLHILGLIIIFSGQICAVPDIQTEDINIGHRLIFKSDILDTTVKLAISLPVGYESSNINYPVLYSFRGAFYHSAGIIRALSRSKYIPEMIVVDYTNCDANFLIPTSSSSGRGGYADSLIVFMENELIPFIEASYRTYSYRILYDGSWGGVFCIYSVLTKPETFHSAIAGGPWIIYDDTSQYILKNTASLINSHTYNNNCIFFNGGQQPELTPSLRELADTLSHYSKPGLQWHYEPMLNHEHSLLTVSALTEGLRYVFSDWRTLPDSTVIYGLDSIKSYNSGLIQKYGTGIKTSALSSKGWGYFQNGQTKTAIEIFKMNVSLFPDSAMAYYSTGRALHISEQYPEALEYYEKALQLGQKYAHRFTSLFEDYFNKVSDIVDSLK